MAHLKKWTAVTVAGAVLSLAGVIGLGPSVSGAAQPNDAPTHSTGAGSPDATPIAPNIYKWFINGVKTASITISGGSFSSTLGTNDSGKFVQAGRTFGLSITGGADALYGCVFAGHVNAKGTGVSSAAKPGNWVCPNFGSGTFYIKAGASATTPLIRSASPRSDAIPATAGSVVLGTHNWAFGEGGGTGTITFAANNTYTSTFGFDRGTWVQAGSAVALSITGGQDGNNDCVLVGKVNTTGTAIGTAAKPGRYNCEGFLGTFTIS
jgi:hypothetical protein